MPTRREYSGNAPATTLSGAITNASTSFTVTDGTGYPTGGVGPFFLVIDPRTASEEKVLVTTRTGTTMSGVSRGQDGTSAVAHSAGAAVEHVWTAVDAGEANRHGADTALDDHTQYHNATRHGSVAHTTAMIGDAQVTTAKIADANVTAAKLAAAVPLGVLGRQSSAATVSVTTAASIVNSVSVTVGAGRLLKISAKFIFDGDGTAGQALVVRVNRGGTEVDRLYQLNDTSGVNNIVTVAGFVLDTPAAGTYTYEIDARTSAGAGSVLAINHFILVEDIGAA